MITLRSCLKESVRFYVHQSVRSCSVRVRFAPSPTGYLHLGGLKTALYNFLFSRKHGGKYILRIEDTDQTRLVSGATEHLIKMLQWTGIEFDEGPHIDGKYGPYVQSERLDIYKSHCKQLLENNHAYRCFCTPERLELLRKHAATAGEVPKYDNRCRHLNEQEVAKKLSENKPFTVRFKLSEHPYEWTDLVYGRLCQNPNEGDTIIMKSDGFPTYHFANVVDDHLMEITHVLRGVEWQISTPKHLMMYDAFGWKPPQFAHLPLLQNKDGKKLSKRQNDVFVDNYKVSGFYPEAVLNLVTNMGSGFDVDDTSGKNLDELIKEFNLSKLQTNSTKVDFIRISHFNQLHLKLKLENHDSKLKLVRELRDLVVRHFENKLLNDECMEELSDEYLGRIFKWTQNRIIMTSDLLKPEYAFLWVTKQPINVDQNSELPSQSSVINDNQREFISKAIEALSAQHQHRMQCQASLSSPSSPSHCSEDLETVESFSEFLRDLCESTPNLKYAQMMKLTRQALNGPKEGPSVAEMMALLGNEKTVTRLQDFLNSNHSLRS